MKFIFFFLTAIFYTASSALGQSAKGYEIKVRIKNYTGDTIKLANYLEDKLYFQKSVVMQNGLATFKNDTALHGGMYAVYLNKEKTHFPILISQNEQFFSIETEGPDYMKNLKFKGAPDNELNVKNMEFYTAMNAKATPYRKTLEENKDKTTSNDYKAAVKALEAMDNEVKAYQQKIIEKHPASLTVKIMKANLPIILPETPKLSNGRPDSLFAWRYYRSHYFDGTDFTDESLIYTDFLKRKITDYFDNYILPEPDSMLVAANEVISKTTKNKEMYRYVVGTLLSYFEASKYVCMDKVFVGLTDKYYCGPNPPFPPSVLGDQKYIDKICSHSNDMRLVRCGEIAPNIKLQSIDDEGKQQETELHQIKAKYILVFFWDPECGQCGKVSDKLVEYYNAFKQHGLHVYGICTKSYDELNRCKEKIKDKKMQWTNYADPYYLAKAKMLYNIKTTPGIFLLDKDKKIILKKFEMDDLKRFLETNNKK
jgi:peroxiredoxin